ncbi:MAG: exodeoxyribonuclease VII large subunit [Burkholderiales bacterium]|nr:exodeoxyribonuclease VII large subunit [Burkholderiales bacterium]
MIEPPGTAPGPMTWGVAALLGALGDAMAARFGAVAVRGELSGFSRAASGHCYFSLKDADGAAALVRCVLFRRAAALLDFSPADGQQVELRGRLALYEARGELQLVAESMQRVGAGTLFEEFLRRRARMEAAGLFDAARKRPLPASPRALGIVTSLGAAALHDVLATLARRAPQVRIVVYPSPVQGAEAPAALVAALQAANRRREVDLLLLVRGGGSIEDLWAFNDERLVQAVAASALPVVCGVGHETDITLCDLAADLRAPTPTAAAELAAPSRDEALQALAARLQRLQRAIERAGQVQAQRLDRIAQRLSQPAQALRAESSRLDERARRLRLAPRQQWAAAAAALAPAGRRLSLAVAVQVREQGMRLAASGRQLAAHDPQRVLRRGYAWVEAADGRAIVSAALLHPGQAVRAVWADGRAQAEVKSIEPIEPLREVGAVTLPTMK